MSAAIIAVAVVGVSAPSPVSQGQPTARLETVVIGAGPPQTTTLPAGVHRLRIAGTTLCLYFEPGANARVIAAPGSPPEIRGALRCEDIWSEVVIDSVPDGVEVRSSAGVVSRRSHTIVVRLELPDSLRLQVVEHGVPPRLAVVRVGAMERHRYLVRPVPPPPELLADTVHEPEPAAVLQPVQPTVGGAPVDPTASLTGVRQRLLTMRSREPSATASAVVGWPTAAAVVGSLVLGAVWLTDTLNMHPNAGRNFAISLGATAGLLAIYWPLRRAATGRAVRAGCGSARGGWERCEADLRGQVERLQQDSVTLVARHAAWVQDTLRQWAAYQEARASFPARVAARNDSAKAIEERNRARAGNRLENERRLRAWQVALGASPLILRSRSARR